MEVQRRRRAEEMASFHAFLSRQNRMETDKIKHIEAIQVYYRGCTRAHYTEAIYPTHILDGRTT